MSEPLEGFRVVELTLAVQGPAAGYIFGIWELKCSRLNHR